MSLSSLVGSFARRVAGLVLDIDDTAVPTEQLRLLQDYTTRHRLAETPQELREMVSFLKKKHAVDALIVAYRNGSMLVSSEEDMDTEALTGTALFNYVRAEIPQSDAILVRAKDWYMLFPFNEKVYILKAGSNLSTIEMHAIAREMEAFLKKKAVETIEPAEVPPAAAAAPAAVEAATQTPEENL